ncbi:MAG TPA: SIMPL domain-containing protein [Pseudonocardia sp.]|nr:SIMPL domain-containing protein [Pseudonocardia sp.]
MRCTPPVAALLLTTLALTGCTASPAAPAPPEPPGITARGVGSVSSRPDTLTIGIGVQTRGRVAQEALDANSRLATSTIDALRGAGVAEADLRTSQLTVSPTQDPNTGRITGYEVSNLLTATLRDVDRAGSVIDAAGAAAGDAVRVQQLEFSVADDSTPRAQARADAVRKAAEQARQLAEAAGVTLGPVRSITELAPDPPTPYERDSRAAQAAVPILPGTQELRVAVEMVYEIR